MCVCMQGCMHSRMHARTSERGQRELVLVPDGGWHEAAAEVMNAFASTRVHIGAYRHRHQHRLRPIGHM
jgi:hypothetical protein